MIKLQTYRPQKGTASSYALEWIEQFPGISNSELAAAMGKTTISSYHTCRVIVQKGLVKRARSRSGRSHYWPLR